MGDMDKRSENHTHHVSYHGNVLDEMYGSIHSLLSLLLFRYGYTRYIYLFIYLVCKFLSARPFFFIQQKQPYLCLLVPYIYIYICTPICPCFSSQNRNNEMEIRSRVTLTQKSDI